MNPWDIVAWIGAICVSILIITLTASIVTAAIKGKSADANTNRARTRVL